jgi:hypothetical protein
MLKLVNEVLAVKGKRLLTIPIITGVLAFAAGPFPRRTSTP